MKKLFNILIFFIIIFLILKNSIEIIESIKFSFNICVNNLFPCLIPFMIISNILINYNFVQDISDILSNITTKIFKVNKSCAFALIMSMISGTPSNSKYLKDLFNNGLINEYDISKCLCFCHFTNPIFILGTIGYSFLGNKRIGLIILISHYLGNFISGILNRNKKYKIINLEHKSNLNKKVFINVLNESIKSTIDTLLLIMGIITSCLIITGLINSIFKINNDYKFIFGILEITQGLKYLSLSNINITLKIVISTFFITFGGFCIHLQIFSILDNNKIRYLPYFINRIFTGILSSFISLILFKLFL